MKQVIQTLKRRDAEKRIPVVRMEIDAQLTALHQALLQQDAQSIKACKNELEKLRREMLLLEV